MESNRRDFLKLTGAAALGALIARPARAADPNAAPPKPGNVLTPDQALEQLMKGNARYVGDVMMRRDFKTDREALVGGQNPFAAILGCADSRVAPEFAFDAGRGDLFVVRVAGNFATEDGIASFEYALQFLGTPLMMVLGHQKCGAVDAAIKAKGGAKLPGHIPVLAAAITPAVDAAAGMPGDPLDNAIRQNVLQNVAKLKGASPIISAFVADKKVRIVGGVYNLANGRIDLVE